MKAPKETPLHVGMAVPPPKGVFGGRKFLSFVWNFLSALVNIQFIIPGPSGKQGVAKVYLSPRKMIVDLTKIESETVSSAWRFATPSQYVHATVYSVGMAVIVGPANTDGATPGLWVLKRERTNQVPIWPPEGMTAAQAENDPDNALVIWWPITLFCE